MALSRLEIWIRKLYFHRHRKQTDDMTVPKVFRDVAKVER